jgi:hypothetical protein
MDTATREGLPYPMSTADDGRVNERILTKEARRDYLERVESSRLPIRTVLHSPEGKRLFLRVFDSLQLSAHFVSVIARTGLPHEFVEKVEAEVLGLLEKTTTELNQAIDGAELLLKNNAIQALSRYAAEPMEFDAPVISSFGRRYLDVLVKFDQLMPLLETLAIYEVITEKEKDARKGIFKRVVKRVAGGTRTFAMGLRKRMNEAPAKERDDDDTKDSSAVVGAEGPSEVSAPTEMVEGGAAVAAESAEAKAPAKRAGKPKPAAEVPVVPAEEIATVIP